MEEASLRGDARRRVLAAVQKVCLPALRQVVEELAVGIVGLGGEVLGRPFEARGDAAHGADEPAVLPVGPAPVVAVRVKDLLRRRLGGAPRPVSVGLLDDAGGCGQRLVLAFVLVDPQGVAAPVERFAHVNGGQRAAKDAPEHVGNNPLVEDGQRVVDPNALHGPLVRAHGRGDRLGVLAHQGVEGVTRAPVRRELGEDPHSVGLEGALLVWREAAAARPQHPEGEILQSGVRAVGRDVAHDVGDLGPERLRKAALDDRPHRLALPAPELGEHLPHRVASGVAGGVRLGGGARRQHGQAKTGLARLAEPDRGQGGPALLRAEEPLVLAEHSRELRRDAALGGPKPLHLAGERRCLELDVVEEVVLGPGLGAAPVHDEVVGGPVAQDGALAGELGAAHVHERARAEVERADDPGVLAWLVLPEERVVPLGELPADPVLYLGDVDVHVSTS